MAVALCPVAGFAAATDISGHWAEAEITSWTNAGRIGGYPDGTFKPDNPITRAEFMALTNRGFGFTAMSDTSFSDVPSTAWYASVVRAAKAAAYIGGYPDGTVKPNAPISREEVAAIIARIKKLPGNTAKADSFTDAASLTWSKAVVGAVAQATIMSGYPDGSFGPKRPITRAEAVVTLNRSLPASATEQPTTSGSGSGGGDDTVTPGVNVRLSGITVDGTPVSGFSQSVYNYTVPVGEKTSVTVAATPARSEFAIGFRQGTGSFAANITSFTATAPGAVEIKVYRKSVGINDTQSRTYTVNLVKGAEPGGLPWEELESVTARDDSQPEFGVNITEVTMVVKPAYTGLIQSISVKNRDAVKQAGSPETWVARVNALFTAADLTASDFEVVRSGGQAPIEISGNWPQPITRITNQDDSQPEFGVTVTEVRIYTSGTGTLTGVTVKDKVAVNQGNNLWSVRFNENVNSFSLTATDVHPAYTPPAPPVESTLITGFNVGYSSMERAYVANLKVVRGEALNVQSIEIKDASGMVLASFPGGALNRLSSPFEFQGIVEAVEGADAAEAKANAGLLADKPVTVTVTTASATDTAEDTYAWDPN
jgi:hypothetical protein